jgi:hypothetical protein
MKRTNAILLVTVVCTAVASCSKKEAVPTAGKTQERNADQPPPANPVVAPPQKPPVATPAQKSPSWTILSRSDLSKQYGKSLEERTWDPSEADVSVAVKHVRSFLEGLKKTTSSKKKREAIERILARPDNYYVCQAYGNTKCGEKVITLNFFPTRDISALREQGKNWRHQLVKVSDGGPDSWEIHYDNDSTMFAGFATAKMLREDAKGPERRWAILSKADLSIGPWRERSKGVWQPSKSQVTQVIQGVRPYLKKLKATTSLDWQRQQIDDVLVGWDKYVCQVVAYSEKGKKRIHLNFISEGAVDETLDPEGRDWRHSYLQVDDGGANFWRIEYDFDAGVYLGFECNGEA